MLVGRESTCQKNLSLTEGMIHGRRRGERERGGDRETSNRKRKTAEIKRERETTGQRCR